MCSTKTLVSIKIMDKSEGGREVGRERGRDYHDFPSKLFCLTVPNHSVEESFCVSESFGYRKKISLRGENHDFL